MFIAMYTFHIAFGIGLIALVMGLAMCKCCCKAICETTNTTSNMNAGKCCACGGKCHKWLGIIISILAIISLVCTVNSGFKQMKMFKDMSPEQMEKMHDDMRGDMNKMHDDMRNDMKKQ